MNRTPLPSWVETMSRYSCIGGVEEFDIWVRDAKRHATGEWDVFICNTKYNMFHGMDVFVTRDWKTHHAQGMAIANRREEMGEDNFRRMVLLLHCFAPQVMKGKLWPEFKKGG